MSSKNSDLAAYMHTSSLTRSLLFTKIQESTPRHPQGIPRGPKGTPRHPQAAQMASKGAPRHPKAPQGAQKAAQKVPQGAPRSPQGTPRRATVPQSGPNGVPQGPQGDPWHPKKSSEKIYIHKTPDQPPQRPLCYGRWARGPYYDSLCYLKYLFMMF